MSSIDWGGPPALPEQAQAQAAIKAAPDATGGDHEEPRAKTRRVERDRDSTRVERDCGLNVIAIETLLEVLRFVEITEFSQNSGHGKWSTVSKAFLAATSALVTRARLMDGCGYDWQHGSSAFITRAALRFPSLTDFDLTGMSLNTERGADYEFPESIVCSMTGLKKLNLSGYSSDGGGPRWDECQFSDMNMFDTLPDFSRLTALTALNVAGVGIKHEDKLLPIRSLVHLTDLDLSANRFAALPDWIGELAELASLNLNGCSRLGWIPPSIGNLRNLKRLQLDLRAWDGRGSADLPTEISSLVSLEVLHYISYAAESDDGNPPPWRRHEECVGCGFPDAICALTELKELRCLPLLSPSTAVASWHAALESGSCSVLAGETPR